MSEPFDLRDYKSSINYVLRFILFLDHLGMKSTIPLWSLEAREFVIRNTDALPTKR